VTFDSLKNFLSIKTHTAGSPIDQVKIGLFFQKGRWITPYHSAWEESKGTPTKYKLHGVSYPGGPSPLLLSWQRTFGFLTNSSIGRVNSRTKQTHRKSCHSAGGEKKYVIRPSGQTVVFTYTKPVLAKMAVHALFSKYWIHDLNEHAPGSNDDTEK
jgi:hypothetical protein